MRQLRRRATDTGVMHRHVAATIASVAAVLAFALGASAPAATAAAPGTMLISAERLASLPTSGAAYTYMKQRADAAMANMSLSSPNATSPWLPNFNGSGYVPRPGVQTLAAALVYARTGDVRYRDFVIRSNRFVIGSEDAASNDGTSFSGKELAVSRNIGAYVLAADLVGMDPAVTGSRPGYTSTVWRTWLGALRTKLIGGSAGSCESMARCDNERAHNWGAFASAGRVAIDVYLGDPTDLAVAVSRLKRWLGESQEGAQWKPTADFDASYACVPAGGSWQAVNGTGCGLQKDGMIVEDISRSALPFFSYDSTGIGYTMEAYQAQLFAGILLQRQGYDVFNWGNQAFRRVMDWLQREGKPFGTNSGVERHVSWIPRYFYGRSYPTTAAGMGRTLGFTDWLYG